jgi:F-type H+-transporting ATPase subunit delta
MSYETIGRRWARAVLEIGKETGSLPRIEADLAAFAAACEASEELRAVLDNPLVPEGSREAIVLDVATKMGLDAATKSTLRLLAKKRRLRVLPDLVRHLARLADEDRGIVRAQVTSARPLGDDYLGKLRGELEKATGKQVIITQKQDPALIGGVVTKIGDRVVDGSVRARLAGFRETLLRQ